jgi:hypothetical protein
MRCRKLERRGQFNIIDLASGWKVISSSQTKGIQPERVRPPLSNRIRGLIDFHGKREDVVLAKLEWAKKSSSERQIEDVAGILRIRANELDRTYIERWIEELQVERSSDGIKGCRLSDPAGILVSRNNVQLKIHWSAATRPTAAGAVRLCTVITFP